jgi:hypothetical protein
MTTEAPKRRGRTKREITPSPFAIKQEEIYNITEAATYSGLNAHMFRQLLDSGKGPDCIKTTGSTGRTLYRFRRSSLDSWLRSQTFVSGAAAPPQGEVTGGVSTPAVVEVPEAASVSFAEIAQEFQASPVLTNLFTP